MNRVILTSIVAACFTTAVAAQTPSGSQPATSGARTSASDKPTTVLTGCVYLEKDVPGRSPNVAERAGVMEDYILAEVRPGGAASAGSSDSTPGATGTSGTMSAKSGTMYKLEKIADERLRAAVGKRVEVTGRLDAEAGDATGAPASTPGTTATDRAIGRDRVDLPEFEVVSMREIAGSCPATPAGAGQR